MRLVLKVLLNPSEYVEHAANANATRQLLVYLFPTCCRIGVAPGLALRHDGKEGAGDSTAAVANALCVAPKRRPENKHRKTVIFEEPHFEMPMNAVKCDKISFMHFKWFNKFYMAY